MTEYINLAVGKPFPFKFHPQEGMTPVIDGASVTLAVVLMRISEQDETAFCKGNLEYGLFVHDAIPFILCGFKGLATFDSYINIHREQRESQDAFFSGEPEANLVQFYLVDGRTGILRGIRAIGTVDNFIADVKQVCFEQLSRYTAKHDVDTVAQKILSQYPTSQLMKRARMFKLK